MRFLRIAPFLLPFTVAAVAQTRPPGTIAINAPNAIHSMDGSNTIYSSIQITSGAITALSNEPSQDPKAMTLPIGAAVYPGFIDSHSHAFSALTAQAKDSSGNPYWINLNNVNVMQLPPCGTPTPGSITCFTPVTSQDTVDSLLSGKANSANLVLGWNYEPSRLTCTVGGNPTYGFLCPDNFTNQSVQQVRITLDGLQKSTPLFVTSESGHIVYVNSAALSLLKICTTSTQSGCHMPIINQNVEMALAQTGQLNEDLALYAMSFVQGELATNYANGLCTKVNNTKTCKAAKKLEFYGKQITSAFNFYSQLGYTTVQEGAAPMGLIEIYMATAKAMSSGKTKSYLPATAAFLEYDSTTPQDFPTSVANAGKMQKRLSAGGYDMFVAGMKAYADGSNQGYTGDMTTPVAYLNQSPPLTQASIYSQPYDGLPDYNPAGLTTAIQAAHCVYGAVAEPKKVSNCTPFPLWIHTNGNQAQTNVLGVLANNAAPQIRDVVVHFAMPTQAQVQSVSAKNVGVTFLANDFYYYYQPLCEQVLGSAATQNLYPAQWAQANNLQWSLHSDASITPPSPLFGMWVATNRVPQQAPWLPKALCTPPATQTITPLQAMRAYTSQAAWLYNRETKIGSLQNGMNGDLVVLSADPLATGANLSQIYVLYTIHNGNIVYPTSGQGPATSGPVWPN